ncbi:MAG: hypothetical protein HOG34_15045, partial [Bacteroidetes bacterium]|nr:hypothetical protein [Bacteroidota bacterium]
VVDDEYFDDSGMPPQPEAFPEGWEETLYEAESIKPLNAPMPEPEPEHPQGEPTQNEGEAEDRVAEEVRKSIPNLDLFDQKQSEHPPRLITVAVKPNGSMERDKRRLKNIHGVLISFPGKDKFSLQIFEGEKGHLIDFPNYNTRICDEMLARLKTVLGSEDWRIEEIVN